MAIILGLTLWVTSLKAEKELYSDNDLKYRYIQMIGHATQEEMATMDTIFYFHRNNRKIKELRKQIEIFEENVKQRARIIEQEERLKRERSEIETKLIKWMMSGQILQGEIQAQLMTSASATTPVQNNALFSPSKCRGCQFQR